jgi:predicted membrane channel-forming protein YqfA (hemolysin III family)
MARRNPSLSKEDARTFLIMGAIFFPSGLTLLLVTGIAGIGLLAMGGFFLAIGGYHYWIKR